MMGDGEPHERYRFLHVLGRGRVGEVHLVEDVRTGVRRALKVLEPRRPTDRGLGERLRREAGVLAQLAHPGLARVVDAGELSDGRPFLVTELIDGERLSALLAREGPQPIARVRSLLAQLVDAVAYAHAGGVAHRDLQPDALALVGGAGGEERLKVLDVGVARIVAPDGAPDLGSAEYLAPEQLRGDPLDGRVDVYAIGCIGYALLVGEPPFVGARAAVVDAKLSTNPVPPGRRRADVPPSLARVLLTCLRRDPTARHASVEALFAALRDEAAHAPPDPAPAETPALAEAPTAEVTLPDAAEAHAATALLPSDDLALAEVVVELGALPPPAREWRAHLMGLDEARRAATSDAERAEIARALVAALGDAARAVEATSPALAASLRRLAAAR